MFFDDEIKKIVIISPHFDDAVLSCAGLIGCFIEEGKTVEICNVFTKIQKENVKFSKVIREYIAEDMNNPIAYVDMQVCEKWIQLRQKEDDRACKFLNCKKRDLGYIDAIFRMKSNQYIYDTEEKLFSEYKAHDEEFMKIDLINRLNFICKDFDACLFPMAIGNHVDHRIVHDMGLEINKNWHNVCFYCEIPYSIDPEFQVLSIEKLNISKLMDLKLKAVGFYGTQLQGLFGTKESISSIIPAYEIYAR